MNIEFDSDREEEPGSLGAVAATLLSGLTIICATVVAIVYLLTR